MFLIVGLAVITYSIIKNIKPTEAPDTIDGIHPLIYYDKGLFFKTRSDTSSLIEKNVKIKGGIVPHHLLAGKLISVVFNQIKTQKPKTVILVGPNHYENGEYKVLTSIYAWKTPFGIVKPHLKFINQLIGKKIAYSNFDVLTYEHSVAGIMPYIKYYLPDVEVVPLILSSRLSQKEIYDLSQEIFSLYNENTIIIASVDFSHYLTREIAQERDNETIGLMKNYQHGAILNRGNDYFDSPSSLVFLLMTMQKLNTANPVILENTNSGILLNDSTIPVTSYFSIVFR